MHPTYQNNLYHDILNLVETWIQLTVCLRQLYPHKHFHSKTAFDCQVPVAKSSHLSQYFSDFMLQFDKIGLENVKMIELNIISKESSALVECHQLTIQTYQINMQEINQTLSFQDLNLKSFLADQMEMMKKMPKITEKCTFRLRVLADLLTKERVQSATDAWHLGRQLEKSQLKESCFLRSGNILITSSVY